MKAVMDTNAMLRCVGKKSLHRNVFDAFLQNVFTLCVTTEILLEYEETFPRFWENAVAQNIIGLLQYSDNIENVSVSFRWLLTNKDEDDNKFVDCYVAASADYLVSNDSAITQLKSTRFPPLTILTLEEFSELLNT